MANEKIRVAVGGQGRSGYDIHCKSLKHDTDRFNIVAAADQLPERREDAEVELGAKVYDDWRPMLEEGGFDLFINALPSPLHVDASIDALNRGFHVVSEKPMARTVADFDRIVEAAEKNDRLLFPFQNKRLQPYFDKIQEIIASGVLGKIVHIRSSSSSFKRRWDWQTRQDLSAGNLLNTGPHPVDQALCLFGWDNTPEVFCRMACENPFEGDAENHVTVTLYDPERIAPQIDIDISSLILFPNPNDYAVSGTYGGLVGGPKKLTWRYFDPETAPKHDMWLWSVDRAYVSEKLNWIEETWALEDEPESLRVGPDRFYDNVFDVLQNGAERLIKPEQTRKQIAVIEECHRQNPLPTKPQSLAPRL
ncbi:MAG: scyllo-inositol 2-dehydrogenase (NADP+) [Candidatus Latescibacterota bacterium]|jgi:scyllo-inositol 2-dehydrogenase (NADP+)